MSDTLSLSILHPDTAQKLARLAELEAAALSLRHDLRGVLTLPLLVTDMLLVHSDPKVATAGEVVVNALMRVVGRLSDPVS